MTRKLKVDLEELAFALNSHSWEYRYFLDLETGAVVLVNEETDHELQRVYDELGAAAQDSDKVHAAIEERDIPDWEKDVVQEAHVVESGIGTRFIRIEPDDSSGTYEEMREFIDTVREPQLQDRLYRAIGGKGAFGRFKGVLMEYPSERERWFAFKNAHDRERTLEWLADKDIKLISEERTSTVDGYSD